VWIYGISRSNAKSTQGTVIKRFTIDYENYNDEPRYLIEVPTEIEPLLEVRTWHTISQTKDGHVGALREVVNDQDAALKMLSRTGMAVISVDDEFTGDGHDGMGTTSEEFDRYYEHMAEEDEVSPDAIHAALEKSQKDSSHSPLVIKDSKPKRRNYHRNKKV
jgi:hypothetical protein